MELPAQGQTLLATLSGPAHPSWTLVAADAWHLIPRRTPADDAEILHQLAQRHVLLVLADTGAAVLTAGEYALLGGLMSGIANSVPAAGLATGHPTRCLLHHGTPPQPRGGEPG